MNGFPKGFLMKLIYLGKERTFLTIEGKNQPIELTNGGVVELPAEMPFVQRGLQNGLFKKEKTIVANKKKQEVSVDRSDK